MTNKKIFDSEQDYQHIEAKDVELFVSMKDKYISKEEKLFFETLHYKEEKEIAPSAELLISENDNADTIYFVRYNVSEYKIGGYKELLSTKENYFLTLADALSANLKEVGVLDQNITLLDWLRRNNYQSVHYDRNLGFE